MEDPTMYPMEDPTDPTMYPMDPSKDPTHQTKDNDRQEMKHTEDEEEERFTHHVASAPVKHQSNWLMYSFLFLLSLGGE
jgi:hypothetical protein